MIVIFLGPPGVGKGTQSVRAAEHYSVPHISTGDMMRAAIANATELGSQVKSYLDSGRLVPDALVINIVADRLRQPDCEKGAFLDGFPRTRPQAAALSELMEAEGRKIDVVVQLTADRHVLQDRMLDRAAQQGRSDDTPETISTRLEIYEEQTAPLVDFYKKSDLLKTVDGMGTFDEVFGRVCGVLDRYK